MLYGIVNNGNIFLYYQRFNDNGSYTWILYHQYHSLTSLYDNCQGEKITLVKIGTILYNEICGLSE